MVTSYGLRWRLILQREEGRRPTPETRIQIAKFASKLQLVETERNPTT